jgi:hypothetical protein
MASPTTLLLYRAPKRKPNVVSMGSIGFVYYWNLPPSQTPVSLRRSEYRRYCKDHSVCAIVPVHLTDIESVREFDLRESA